MRDVSICRRLLAHLLEPSSRACVVVEVGSRGCVIFAIVTQ